MRNAVVGDYYCDYDCCVSLINVITENNDGEINLLFGYNYDNQIMMIQDLCSKQKIELENSVIVRMLQETDEATTSGGGVGGMPLWVSWVLIVILLLVSSLFSGLTLGLMSLDPSGLEIVMANSDDPANARAAKAIYPVRQNGNLLLCTLVIGNVLVNSCLSILMADLTGGIVGLVSSTVLIVVFAEILPQAVCSRFALQVGERTVPIVKVFMALLFPVTYPLSFILNKVLGHEIGITYSTSEMTKLIEMHVQRGDLEDSVGAAMAGALRFRNVIASEVMTPLADTFMLSADERLGFDVVAKIFKMGYSRIPVYEISKSNIVGLLFVKDLIFMDPEDELLVKNFVQIFGRGLHVVWADDHLGNVLKLLKRGSHMALVRDVNNGDGKGDPFYEIKGILTLEDIVEVILGADIIDETDVHRNRELNVLDPEYDVSNSEPYIDGFIGGSKGTRKDAMINGKRNSTLAVDWESRLRLLDARLVDEHLKPEEIRAVAAHLKTNHSNAVELISNTQLQSLLTSIPVTEIQPASSVVAGESDEGSGVPTDSAELIYERGVPANFCTVVLSGKILIIAGADKFRSEISNWGVIASRALTDPAYIPDFSAWVLPNQNGVGGCRCIKLDRMAYSNAVDNTAVERNERIVDEVLPAAMSSVTAKDIPSALSGSKRSGLTLADVPSVLSGSRRSGLTESTGVLPTPTLAPLAVDTSHLDTAYKRTIVLDGHGAPSSNVRTDDERKAHSRRRQLRKAFSRARKEET
jgi:metal transporter CNNM